MLAHDLVSLFITVALWRLDPDPAWLTRLGVVGLARLLGVALFGYLQITHERASFTVRPPIAKTPRPVTQEARHSAFRSVHSSQRAQSANHLIALAQTDIIPP